MMGFRTPEPGTEPKPFELAKPFSDGWSTSYEVRCFRKAFVFEAIKQGNQMPMSKIISAMKEAEAAIFDAE